MGRLNGVDGHRKSNGKLRAFALLRNHTNRSAKHADRLAGYGQSQSYTFLALCIGQTGEGVEDALLFALGHSATRISHTHSELRAVERSRHGNSATVGVLHGIADKIVHNLTYAESVSLAHTVGSRTKAAHHFKILFIGNGTCLCGAVAYKLGRIEAHGMRRSLATLKLMIVEQSTHELQKMFGRRTYAVKISHGLGLVDPLAEQSYKSGDRSYWRLDVVRDGKQESLALLHDSFSLVLGFYYALMVAPLATNIAQRINYQHNGSTNGEQCQHSNLHHRSMSGSHIGIDSTLHGVVLIALNVLKHLSGTPRQLYADELERTRAVVDSILPASVGTLYLMMDVGKSLSNRVGYVDALSHGSGVGASALHRSGYSV